MRCVFVNRNGKVSEEGLTARKELCTVALRHADERRVNVHLYGRDEVQFKSSSFSRDAVVRMRYSKVTLAFYFARTSNANESHMQILRNDSRQRSPSVKCNKSHPYSMNASPRVLRKTGIP